MSHLGKRQRRRGETDVYDQNKNHTQEPHKDHNTYCISYPDGTHIPLSLLDIWTFLCKSSIHGALSPGQWRGLLYSAVRGLSHRNDNSMQCTLNTESIDLHSFWKDFSSVNRRFMVSIQIDDMDLLAEWQRSFWHVWQKYSVYPGHRAHCFTFSLDAIIHNNSADLFREKLKYYKV